MAERKTYTINVPLTDQEAEALLEMAGRRGQSIGTLISGIITDIATGAGDEGDLIQTYLERSEPVGAEKSFVAYCLRWGYDPGTLADLGAEVARHAEQAVRISEAIKAGIFPEDDGWAPDTTLEDAEAELRFHQEAGADAGKERAELWRGYQEATASWGGGLDEAGALAEAEAYKREVRAFLRQGQDADES